MLYPIAISTGDQDHAWGVEVPDIPGCYSAGDDLDDAMAMAREAIEGHFEILAEDARRSPALRKSRCMPPTHSTLAAPGRWWTLMSPSTWVRRRNSTSPCRAICSIALMTTYCTTLKKKAARVSSRQRRSRCCNKTADPREFNRKKRSFSLHGAP